MRRFFSTLVNCAPRNDCSKPDQIVNGIRSNWFVFLICFIVEISSLIELRSITDILSKFDLINRNFVDTKNKLYLPRDAFRRWLRKIATVKIEQTHIQI